MRRLISLAFIAVLLSVAFSLPAQVMCDKSQLCPAGGGGGSSWTTNAYTCANQASSSTTATCTFSTSPTAGMSVFCSVISFTSGQTFSISDSNGDTFTMIGSQFADTGNNRYIQLGWFPKLTTTITTVTLTETASGYPTINCDAATDSGASPALDGAGCSAGPTTSTTANCGPISLAASDYVFAVSITVASGTILTAQSPLTNGSSNNNANLRNGYGVTSTSVTPTFSLNASDSWDIVAAAFKP